jgi:2-C-methyl-D-erythritol 4-phosphate cytidylyltransferase
MVYGLILAGGIGSRMGNVEKPKQFLHIGKKPIIVHTLEKFYINKKIDYIIVLCPEQWVSYTRDLLKKYIEVSENIAVIAGGETRNETIMNGIRYIEEQGNLNEDTVVITHDAVRPFVTHRIIDENIECAKKGVACDTVVPATDTIVESLDKQKISSIPDRSKYYQGQTPQSFKAKHFKELYESLSAEEKAILTDAAKVFVIKGEEVRLVMGETFNIKVTYPYDLQLAEVLLGGNKNC